jgi:hypothetical protein
VEVVMLATEITSEQEALQYIEANKQSLLKDLGTNEVKTIYTDSNTKIHIIKDGTQILKVISRFEDCKETADLLKFTHA